MEEKYILKIITEEIEQRFNCKVMHISLANILGTPNVNCKIQYNDDFICSSFNPPILLTELFPL